MQLWSVSNNCQERDPSSKPLWLGMRSAHCDWESSIPYLPFPTAKKNQKKTTKKSPKTSNFPQVDCSTLIVEPIICVFSQKTGRPLCQLANRPTGQLANRPVPHPHWALRTSSISSSMVGYPSPRHPDGSGRWVFGWKMLFAVKKWFICKNGFTGGSWILSCFRV